MKKYLLHIVFVLFFLILFFVIYNFYIKKEQGIKIISDINKNSIQQSLIDSFKLNIDKIPDDITEEDFLKGFWYLYIGQNGEEEVRFFNPQDLLNSGMSKNDILNAFDQALQYEIVKKSSMVLEVNSEKLPEGMGFNNKIYDSNALEYDNLKIKLENKQNKEASDFKRLAQLYGVEGLYSKQAIMNNKACKLDNKYCQKTNINISGVVINQLGDKLSDVNIKLLSKENQKIIKTDKNGKYNFNIDILELENVRMQFELEGYTSSIYLLNIFDKERKKYNIKDIILSNSSVLISKIDLKNFKVLSGNAIANADSIFIETRNSRYEIPTDAFWDGDKKYNGIVNIVTFEFSKNNQVPESFLNIDAFGDGVSSGLNGTSMVSMGMPYMEVFDNNNNRLFIKKDNPAILSTKVVDKEEYSLLIKDIGVKKINNLLEKSKKDGISITQKYLDDNFINYPAWWVLDQKRGVWENVPFSLLNEQGDLKTIYYTSKY